MRSERMFDMDEVCRIEKYRHDIVVTNNGGEVRISDGSDYITLDYEDLEEILFKLKLKRWGK
jgi:hypothetical protein